MAKWVKWFASFLFTSSKDEKEFTESLALSMSVLDSNGGWYIIESDEDIRADLLTKKERKAREREIQQVGSFNVKTNRNKDWLKTFADLLLTLPEGNQEIAFNSLASDMRVSILNRVIKIRGQQWLEMVEKIFRQVVERSNESSNNEKKQLLDDLKATWEESTYAKGRLGALRDFTMLSYTEERLSPKMLKAIHASMLKSFQVLFRVQLQTQLTPDDVIVIEDTLALAIPDLIALHCQAAQLSKNSQEKVGKLPAKWREDDLKLAQKLSEIKAKGVDAKWEEPVPYKPPEVSQVDFKEAAQILDKLLSRSPRLEKKNQPESKNEGKDSDSLDLDQAIAEKFKVHVKDEERMKMETLQQRRGFLFHNLFSPRHITARAIGSSA